MKLTKMQSKANDRIDAWVQGKNFQENARTLPSVPELTTEYVLENYTPTMPESTAQFFTPLEMAQELAGYVTDNVILDPCAGIGSLLYPIHESVGTLHAWEMDPRAYAVGKKLFPDVTWTLGNAFEIFDNEGFGKFKQFECVIMNPPFSIQWGLSSADKWSISGAKKSEHLFMELAIRVVVPGGIVLAILPCTYFDTMQAKFHKWFDQRAEVDNSWELGRDFKLTRMRTSLFYIRKRES